MASKGRKNIPSEGYVDDVAAGSAVQAILVKQDAIIDQINENQVMSFTSAAGAGGAASAALTVTGLLSTDTIISVCQKTHGANNLPLLGYSTQANNSLTAIWSADPGAGPVIVVTVLRNSTNIAKVALK